MLYLLLQLFNGSKLSLIAQASKETNTHNIAVKVARPAHDVSLDGRLRSRALKRRARSDICDAAPPRAFNQRGRHVHAAARDDSILRTQVGGRKSKDAPALSAMHDAAFDAVRPPQHATR